MLLAKERLVVQQLLFQSEYTTSDEIAENLGLSEKTVRKYIKNINGKIEKENRQIVAKKGYGYLIEEKDREYFVDLCKEESDDDRIYRILYLIFIEDKKMGLTRLASSLGISVSTLKSDLCKIRKQLKEYNIKFSQSLEYEGSEKDIRRFICNYFFSQNDFELIYKELDVDPELGKEILMIIIDHCRKNHFIAYDYFARNLVIHILLSIKRVSCGCAMKNLEEHGIDADIIQMATQIVHDINLISPTKLPEEEIVYIAIHLESKLKSNNLSQECLEEHLIDSSKMFCKLLQIEYVHDDKFISDLSNHMQALIKRNQNEVSLKNPLTKDILEKYPATFEAVSKIYRNDPYFKGILFTDDEVAYIAIHYLTSMERIKANEKLNVIVISATGYASTMFLKQRLLKTFGERLQVTDVASAYDLTNEKLKNVDFIVSTVDAEEVWWGIPIIKVSVFLDDEDIRKIRDYLDNERSRAAIESPIRLLQTERFRIFEEKISKQELLKTILKDIVHQTSLDFKTLLKYINYHEELATSAFCENIAVPHPQFKVDGLDQSVVYVAICRQGVVWDEHFPNIRLVILIIPKDYQDETLKLLMSRLVMLSEDYEVQEKLIQSKDYHQFLETCQEYVRRKI